MSKIKAFIAFNLSFFLFILKNILFIYSWGRERERARMAETQAEGEAGSMQEAWHGTRSQDSKIKAWAEGGAKLWATWAAHFFFFFFKGWHEFDLLSQHCGPSVRLM